MVAWIFTGAVQAWEWIAVAYFAYLLVLWPRARPARRATLGGSALIALLVIAGLAWAPQTPLVRAARCWLPALYVLLGYYLSAAFFRAPMPPWEARLAAFDRRWLVERGVLARSARAPRWLREGLELAYFVCPAIVPAGALVFGTSPALSDLHRYWTPMLLAAFLSYGALPWIQTRPPRALEPQPGARTATVGARLNTWVVRYGQHGYNTFPSGHVAAASVAALVAMHEAPAFGAPLLVLWAAIAAGSVLGRYHYLLDAIAGALLAAASVAIVAAAGR